VVRAQVASPARDHASPPQEFRDVQAILSVINVRIMSKDKTQKSILGFFQRGPAQLPVNTKKQSVANSPVVRQPLTPAPSSDAVLKEEDEEEVKLVKRKNALPSPVTPATSNGTPAASETSIEPTMHSSPLRKVYRVYSPQK
jgi:hypothetical protein